MSLFPIQAIYLHIPFCHTICPFCAFAVRKDRKSMHQPYLELLCQEIQMRSEQLKEQLGPLESIYIGGGTPSRLSLDEVNYLMHEVQSNWDWSDTIEIAFEVNPEDVTSNYIKGLLALGITRISLGAQSIHNKQLQTLKRVHTAQQVKSALEVFQATGLDNFNIDVMFGIPRQTLEDFQNDVTQILSYQPHHISLYGLDIEPNTPFARQSSIVEWVQQNQSLSNEMYLWIGEQLKKKGVIQYEVSNFAQPGFEGRSNLLVWSGKPYLGFGIGAHSFVNQTRWGNHRTLKPYQTQIEKQEWPINFEEKLTLVQQANEVLMLGLRQTSGFSIDVWTNELGIKWPDHNMELIESLCLQQYAQWDKSHLTLTPLGFLMADEITSQLMLEEKEDTP